MTRSKRRMPSSMCCSMSKALSYFDVLTADARVEDDAGKMLLNDVDQSK